MTSETKLEAAKVQAKTTGQTIPVTEITSIVTPDGTVYTPTPAPTPKVILPVTAATTSSSASTETVGARNRKILIAVTGVALVAYALVRYFHVSF
jgi:hypothetical protein